MGSTGEDKKPHVVVLGGAKYVGEEYLASVKNELDLEFLDVTNRNELQEKLRLIAEKGPIHAFIITSDTPPYVPFDEDLLKSVVPHCRIIASAWAGYNEFDVPWMTSQNIWFCNTVDAVAESTADLAIFLTIAVVRNTYLLERTARQGGDPTGMTLGIVGMGSIGRYLAKKAAAFNMRVKYYNRKRVSADVEAECKATYCASLHELLSQADVVSINCPLTDATKNLISSKEFAAFKDGAFLINTARGPIVNEDALIEALESGKITRAGLDVFDNEPGINEYFKTSDKVVIQPHVGGWTEEALRRAERECFENVRALFRTGRPVAPVNTV